MVCNEQATKYYISNKEYIKKNRYITDEQRIRYNVTRRQHYQRNKERIKAYQRERYILKKKINPLKRESKTIISNGVIVIY
jgi:hypothetical protein